ncbi:hypothetical protein HGRIS_010709 [Hohenbuehelia grisea]|uniref:Hydrophobin n=1 Tax=Hohenbuehelia grisea TaxID=104357 RepID=A0ABR3IXU4_9AGAR
MFARASSVAILALPVLAAATAVPRDLPASQCNTGDLQCCNQTQTATPALTSVLGGLLGIVLGPITGLIGLTCSPLSVIGVGGNSCSQQPVCCSNNSFNGVIALGCLPVNLNL